MPRVTVADVAAWLEAFAPLELAAPWDNVGLLLGDGASVSRRVMTCLTVTPDSVAEAIQEGAQLIVSHHPILFKPAQRWTTATVEGRLLLDLVRAGVAVYSPHTAFDNAPGGINDQLAQKLGLGEVKPLRAADSRAECKLAVFVPDSDLARVSDALFAAGAGQIGQYRECSFRLAGQGTFFGGAGANPTVGQAGRRETVDEWRLEVVCPESRVDAVVTALRAAHSYEEPAYDIYALRPRRGTQGQGRLGTLPAPMTLDTFATQVRACLNATCVQTVGQGKRQIQRVALACGAAGEFMHDGLRQRADVFLTGEMRFHDCLAAETQRLAVVVAGHYATERHGVETLAALLRDAFADLEVWPSRREHDPLH